jgi:hypothetical protein
VGPLPPESSHASETPSQIDRNFLILGRATGRRPEYVDRVDGVDEVDERMATQLSRLVPLSPLRPLVPRLQPYRAQLLKRLIKMPVGFGESKELDVFNAYLARRRLCLKDLHRLFDVIF